MSRTISSTILMKEGIDLQPMSMKANGIGMYCQEGLYVIFADILDIGQRARAFHL